MRTLLVQGACTHALQAGPDLENARHVERDQHHDDRQHGDNDRRLQLKAPAQ